jgi:hypothetical protein
MSLDGPSRRVIAEPVEVPPAPVEPPAPAEPPPEPAPSVPASS